jgi:hypothetical protein
LEKGQERTELFYSTDGSIPSRKSKLYENPIVAKDSLKLNVVVLTDGSDNGRYYERKFKMTLSTAIIPVFKTKYSQSYAAGGDDALTNGCYGTENFRDGNWQGFEGEDMVATLDFGNIIEISKVSAGFLQSISSWIFFPIETEYLISDDGINFTSIGKVNASVSPKNVELQIKRYEISLPVKTKLRFIKIAAKNIGVCPDWHPAAGGKAWIFSDEITVE